MKKKTLLKFLVLCLSLIVFLPVGVLNAFALEDGMYKYKIENGGAVITEYLGAGINTVVLPSSLGGYPVTGIDKSAFGDDKNGVKSHSEVKKVIIHNGIKFIGDRAFKGTEWFDSKASADSNGFLTVNGMLINYLGSETKVTVPDTVSRINVAAFEKNESITEVTLPASVTVIDDYSFYKCTALKKATVKGNITSIGKSAFYGCSSLESVVGKANMTFPDSLEFIGENAFYNCVSLKGDLNLGLGIKTLSTYSFVNCPLLKSIRLPDTVENFGNYPMGFMLEKRDGAYYPVQIKDFTVYVSHKQAEDINDEKDILKNYSKTSFPIYKYASNPDSTGYFSSFNIVWDRLMFDFMLGDVNNDGKISSTDARIVLRHALKLNLISDSSDLKAADVNKDNKITSADARFVLRAALKIEQIPSV